MKNHSTGFVALTLCLVFIIAFCITGSVAGRSKVGEHELENYYRQQERELLCRVRDYLEQAGFQNSGIMLTKVMEADGRREYTLTIHHGRIDAMDEQAKADLKNKLTALDFKSDNCTFCHEFLAADS